MDQHPTNERRYCLHCHYNLQGLPQCRCPECGQPFDPFDPETFAQSPKGQRRITFRMLALAMLYPLVPMVLIFATWLSAKNALGRVPRTSWDDPKGFSGLTGMLYDCSLVGMLGFIVYMPLMPLLLINYLMFGRERERALRTFVLLLSYGLVLGGSIIVARNSAIMDWYMD